MHTRIKPSHTHLCRALGRSDFHPGISAVRPSRAQFFARPIMSQGSGAAGCPARRSNFALPFVSNRHFRDDWVADPRIPVNVGYRCTGRHCFRPNEPHPGNEARALIPPVGADLSLASRGHRHGLFRHVHRDHPARPRSTQRGHAASRTERQQQGKRENHRSRFGQKGFHKRGMLLQRTLDQSHMQVPGPVSRPFMTCIVSWPWLSFRPAGFPAVSP